jgi:hypothetical protein
MDYRIDAAAFFVAGFARIRGAEVYGPKSGDSGYGLRLLIRETRIRYGVAQLGGSRMREGRVLFITPRLGSTLPRESKLVVVNVCDTATPKWYDSVGHADRARMD